MTHSNKLIEAAAADFGRHSKGGGGWALGLEVAACVEKGTRGGDRRANNDRSLLSKVDATEFAAKSGTSTPRVLRHLEAWERAAATGIVAPASDLSPSDWNDGERLPADGHDWTTFYDAKAAGGRPRDSKPEDAVTIIERRGVEAVVEAMSDEQVQDIVEHAARNRPHATRVGLTRSAAGDREAPFDEPPTVGPNASRTEARMDANELVDSLNSKVHEITRHIHGNREAWQEDPHTLRYLETVVNRVTMLPDLVRGVSDVALEALLAGEER